MFPGTVTPQGVQLGTEEYDGEWNNDQMHGRGNYKFTSGNEYNGEWCNNVMNGFGKMLYADGSSYEGNWENNQMSGEGVYIDSDKITWTGIFVNGQYDSKIQKKLQAEKILKDKISSFEIKAKNFFTTFDEAFAKSDKKTFKDNLGPFFGTSDTCIDYVNVETFPKFEDRPADKWNEIVKAIFEDTNGTCLKALGQKDEASMINPEAVLVEQLKSKPGG